MFLHSTNAERALDLFNKIDEALSENIYNLDFKKCESIQSLEELVKTVDELYHILYISASESRKRQ